MRIILIVATAALSLLVQTAAAQTPNTPARPGPPVIVELEQSLNQKPADPILMGRLAAEYQKAGRWRDGYQLAIRRLSASPEDAAALYDAGAAAFWMITGGRRELTPQEIGRIAEEGVLDLSKAIARVRDFTSAMIYQSQLYRARAESVSDPKEIERFQNLAAGALNNALQTRKPGAATGLPPGAFAQLPVLVVPRDLRSQDLLPPGTATFIAMFAEVPKAIARVVEEPGAAQNPLLSFEPQILSPNPAGYNVAPTILDVTNKLRVSSYSLMPEAALKGEKRRVDLLFTIMKDGKVQDVRLIAQSGNPAFDQAAIAAVQMSRFAPFPDAIKMDQIRLRIAFLYNIKPDWQ
jgi:TonB family protein